MPYFRYSFAKQREALHLFDGASPSDSGTTGVGRHANGLRSYNDGRKGLMLENVFGSELQDYLARLDGASQGEFETFRYRWQVGTLHTVAYLDSFSEHSFTAD